MQSFAESSKAYALMRPWAQPINKAHNGLQLRPVQATHAARCRPVDTPPPSRHEPARALAMDSYPFQKHSRCRKAAGALHMPDQSAVQHKNLMLFAAQ